MLIFILAIVLVINFALWVYFILKGKKPDGVIVVTEDPSGKKVFSLELNKSPEEIEKMKIIFFKVIPMNPDTIILYSPLNDEEMS